MAAENALCLNIDPESLRPIIRAAVEETVRELNELSETAGDKIAFTEEDAARLLSLRRTQLRDERLRGNISASHVVGKRVRYLKSDLLKYMMRVRTGG